ncbi:hypothetical protein Pan44_17870 [Caulifigura coniformis]|uniref:Ser-Thr-rich glycosyl-phosphatidyl-inositol-anchored membrane family protein n=1 Tax=Caulifigura coniformis TaxID=2527983 RepID=A0A517SCD3_9PLAN|nr:hypothetical protein [Caulifigura coniformis]QDT53764.1 hypothetical protein Pan44_17870 [Caulifigura coniformis]
MAGVAGLLLAAPLAAAEGPGGKPLYTQKPRFRIPFQFDAAEMQRLGAVEIQLFVSTDMGTNWNREQSVDPTAGKFAFEAPGNGEYWFAVRTVDRNQKVFPEGPPEVGLRVVVDSQPPSLDLRVEALGRDRVSLSWDASDPNIDPSSLKIEWRDEVNREWQTVGIYAAASGQTSWTTRGVVEVRGSIRDLAGNPVESSASTRGGSSLEAPSLPAFAPARSPRRSEPDFSKPVAEAMEPLPPEFENPPQTAMQPSDPQFDALPIVRSQAPSGYFRQQHRTGMLTNSNAANRPAITDDRWGPPIGQGASAFPSQTAGVAVRSVRSRTFKIGYQLDDVGPSGVANVDLYITEDGGRKWFHYGSDADRQSPFDVTVPADGTYGFCIRVQNGLGVVADPPQPGDAPDIRISIDQSAPVAQLLPLRQGQGSHNNQVLIEWSVQDELLAEQPVALTFAESPTGPWRPITGWTENSGRYVWTITEPLKQRVYIRLEARDAAGNTSIALAEQPLLVDLSRPTARIVDVEVGRTPQ